ncbi:MAG TPA: hypothetical protein VNG95_00855 [Gemmatimonadales bacterium]|nr:hypothetical protein [Gemmatimonadales bacterium]
MTRLSSVLCALTLVSAPLAAQTRPSPNLFLTVFGGVTMGHDLWRIERQPLCVIIGNPGSCGPYDTLALSRRIGSSLLIGVGASYFHNPYFGFDAQISYLGFTFEDQCTGLFYNPDSENRNQQTCNSISQAAPSASAVAFSGSVVLRPAPRGLISPYLRAGIGLIAYSGGTVEMDGDYVSSAGGQPTTFSRAVITDPNPKTSAISLMYAVGVTSPLGPGYQFRLEVRDAFAPLDRITGPANDFGLAPHETRWYHHFGLAFGLDVVLEQKRGRRY